MAKFEIVLTAVDRYSKVFQKAIASVLSLNKPITETQKQLKDIDKDRKVRTLAEDTKNLGSALSDAHGVMSGLLPQLAAIGSVGAIAAAVPRVLSFGQETYNASIATGIAVEKMLALDLASQKVGVSQGVATEAIHQFNSALNAARWGQNNALRDLLFGTGVKFGTRESPVETMEVFRRFLEKFDALRKAGATDATLESYATDVGFGSITKLLMRPAAERDAMLAKAARDVPLTQGESKELDESAKALSDVGNWLVKWGGRSVIGWQRIVKDVGSGLDTLQGVTGPMHPVGRGEGASAVIGGVRAALARPAVGGTAAYAAAAPASVAAPLLADEKVEAYLDRRDAARRKDFETAFRAAHPDLFAPTAYQRVRPPTVNVAVTFAGAVPPGTSASASVEGSGVNAATHFGHFLSPIMQGPRAMAYSDQLQRASYNGVPFGVDSASITVGRRVALHEYPFKDIPWAEDIGRATRKLSIKGFLVSDSRVYGGGDVLGQRDRLLGAVESKGPGQLVHPSLGERSVSCLSIAVTERTDKGRYFEVEFSFYESGERLFPSTGSDTGGTSLAYADFADSASIGDFFSRASKNLAYGAQVANEAVATAFKWGQPAIMLVRDATNLAHLASVLPGAFGRYFGGANVGGLQLLGNTGNLIYSSSVSVASLVNDATAARALVQGAVDAFTTLAGQNQPDKFAASAQNVAESVRAACADPADALRLLLLLAHTPQGQNPTDTTSPVSAAVADMQQACNDLYRRAAVVALARASTDYRPASYDDALDKRDKIVAALDGEIIVAGDQGEDDSYQSLRQLRRGVVIDLTTRGATLAEMKTFVEPSPMPALAIANELYRDATRADELVVQVDPIHPAFMPLFFSRFGLLKEGVHMSPLIICIFVTIAAMFHIGPPPYAGVPLWKTVVAFVFIVLVWVLFVVTGPHFSLTG